MVATAWLPHPSPRSSGGQPSSSSTSADGSASSWICSDERDGHSAASPSRCERRRPRPRRGLPLLARVQPCKFFFAWCRYLDWYRYQQERRPWYQLKSHVGDALRLQEKKVRSILYCSSLLASKFRFVDSKWCPVQHESLEEVVGGVAMFLSAMIPVTHYQNACLRLLLCIILIYDLPSTRSSQLKSSFLLLDSGRKRCLCINSSFPYHSILDQEHSIVEYGILNLKADIFRAENVRLIVSGLISDQRHADWLVSMADMRDYARLCFLRLRSVCQCRWFGWQYPGPGRTSKSHELIRQDSS